MIYAKQPKFVLPEPANQNQLAYVGTSNVVEWTANRSTVGGGFSHHVPKQAPVCKSSP